MINEKHFDIIRSYCNVIAEVSEPYFGIYYKEDGFGYAEFDTPSGVAMYSCNSLKDFQMLCESVTGDDGDCEDDFLGGGFDPYEGGYTFDC